MSLVGVVGAYAVGFGLVLVGLLFLVTRDWRFVVVLGVALIWGALHHGQQSKRPRPLSTEESVSQEVRSAIILDHMRHVPQPVLGWLSAFLLGDKEFLTPEVKQSFKRVGIYHILVVSGGHISLIVIGLHLLLELPFRTIYVLTAWLRPHWIRVKFWIAWASLVIIWIYSWLIGLETSVQRALLLHTFYVLSRLYWGRSRIVECLTSAAVAQMILFPDQFMCLGTALSWGTFLILVFHQVDTFGPRWFQVIHLQAKILLAVTIFLQRFSVFWLVSNPLVSGLCSILLLTGVFIILWPESGLAFWSIWAHNWFLLGVGQLDSWSLGIIDLPEPVWSILTICGLGLVCMKLSNLWELPEAKIDE